MKEDGKRKHKTIEAHHWGLSMGVVLGIEGRQKKKQQTEKRHIEIQQANERLTKREGTMHGLGLEKKQEGEQLIEKPVI